MVYKFFKEKKSKPKICPREEDLACFLEKKLSLRQEDKIKRHILDCQSCSEIISHYYLEAQKEVPSFLLEKVKEILKFKESPIPVWVDIVIAIKENLIDVISSTGELLFGDKVLPLAVLRSEKPGSLKDEVVIVKETDNFYIKIIINKKPNLKAKLTINILEKITKIPPPFLRVSLFRKDIELESYVAEKGIVIFEDINPDTYLVKFIQNSESIGLVKLEIL
ncbi:MAG: hypothetical protein NC900_01550 [Candidatus Omnitrophica bacterium]|nr:hypothetical protein [Candidatus Omnitrophota bacterium]